MAWNWRLQKTDEADCHGNRVERLSFVSVYLGADNTTIEGYGDSPVLDQFSELAEDSGFPGPVIRYDPIDDDEARRQLRFTLTKLLEALDKPVLDRRTVAEDEPA